MNWTDTILLVFVAAVALFVAVEAALHIYRWLCNRSKSVGTYGVTFVAEALDTDLAPTEFSLRNGALCQTVSAPIIGWTAVPGTDNGVVRIDANGFRNDAPDTTGKTVVGIFGGSVAMGSFASCNEAMLSARIEHYLRRELGDNVVVLNFAQSSFTTIQEVCLFALTLDTFDIHVAIFVDGVNDTSAMTYGTKPFLGYIGPCFGGIGKSFSTTLKVGSFLPTLFRFLCFYSEAFRTLRTALVKLLNKEETEVAGRDVGMTPNAFIVNHFQNIRTIIARQVAGSDRKVLMALQPCLQVQTRLTDQEREFFNLFTHESIEFWKTAYASLKRVVYTRSYRFFVSNAVDGNVVAADFSDIMEPENQTLFVDNCHFGDRGNDIFARRIADVVLAQGWISAETLAAKATE